MHLILATKSPRRIEILKDAGFEFEIIPSSYEEPFDENLSPEKLVMMHAENKALDVAQKYRDATVIGVDTIGFVNGKILEKPRDRAHAKEMIKLLSTYPNQVYSGIAVVNLDLNKKIVQSEKTDVFFGKMTDADIEWYLDQNEWVDKSAAYSIQEKGALFIEKIHGDFFNVVGLPLYRLRKILVEEFGYINLTNLNILDKL
jgi:septum formation protein